MPAGSPFGAKQIVIKSMTIPGVAQLQRAMSFPIETIRMTPRFGKPLLQCPSHRCCLPHSPAGHLAAGYRSACLLFSCSCYVPCFRCCNNVKLSSCVLLFYMP